jgi:RNA polymerase-binding transcription factor DksA
LIARDYLLHQQKHLVQSAREDQPVFGVHMAEVATDNFDRDFALSRASSEQEALNEINAALARIREGTFGICELTGKPIERARLEAIPWTRFSKSAEQELEKEGGIRRAQLAPRHAVPRGGDENESEEAMEEKPFPRQ